MLDHQQKDSPNPATSAAEQLALRSIFPEGRLSFETVQDLIGQYDNEPSIIQRASIGQLKRFDQMQVAQLDRDQHQLIEKALEAALCLPFTPNLEDFTRNQRDAYADAEVAAHRLSLLRNGQPDPILLQEVSPTARDALDYLKYVFSQLRPTVRLMVGDMGEGKSTFAAAMESHCQLSNIYFERHVVSRTTSFDVFYAARGIMLPEKSLAAAIQQLAAVAIIDSHSPLIQKALDAFKSPPLSSVMRNLIRYTQQNAGRLIEHDSAASLAQQAKGAITDWYTAPSYSRITQLREFNYQIGAVSVFSGKASKAGITTIIHEFLDFYRACGIHPVYLYDEFESITQFNAKEKDIALGFFRDVIDIINETKGASIFLFSTSDGLNAIRQYGALDDRLKASSEWSLTAPTWHVRHFSSWDASHFLETLLALYQSASLIDSYHARATAEHIEVYRELGQADGFVQALSDSNTLPRERIKALVSLLDSAVNGEAYIREKFNTLFYTPPAEEEEPLCSVSDELAEENAKLYTSFHDFLTGSNNAEHISLDDEDIDALPFGREIEADGPHEPDSASTDLAEKALTPSTPPPLQPDAEPALLSPSVGCQEELDFTLGGPLDGLTEAGRQRKRQREKEVLAVCGWVETRNPLANRPKEKTLEAFIFGSEAPAHFAARVAAYRDEGGLMNQFNQRPSFIGESDDFVLPSQLKYNGNKEHALLRFLRKILSTLLTEDKTFVTVPGDEAFRYERKSLAEQDEREIKAGRLKFGHKAFLDLVPNKPLFPKCHQLKKITPDEDIKTLRKFVYSLAASKNLLPPDEWVDAFVLGYAKARFQHVPPASRNGIQFIVERRGLMSMFDNRRTLAVRPLTDKAM